MDAPANDDLLAWNYPPEVVDNNLKVGAVMTSFLRWYRSQPAAGATPGGA